MFDIKPKTLHGWYKYEMSDYDKDIASSKWGEKTLDKIDAQTGELQEIKNKIPIAKAENFGTSMTVDEKQIGKKMYSIMTNAQTGKIALLAQTMKPEELKNIVEKYIKEAATKVESISCDMSPSYKKFCRENFAKADIVIDKFHVVKYAIEAMQQVRKAIKTSCLLDNKTQSPATENEQWTTIEMIERSRYIATQYRTDWDEEQTQIMTTLFKQYPNPH